MRRRKTLVLLCVLLIVLGLLQAVFYHTSHLRTPVGSVGVGMTLDECEAVLGPSVSGVQISLVKGLSPQELDALKRRRFWDLGDRGLWIDFDHAGKAIWLSRTDFDEVEPFLRRLIPW